MADSLLEVRHLKKYFKTNSGMLHAVDDINFNLQEGRSLGLVRVFIRTNSETRIE